MIQYTMDLVVFLTNSEEETDLLCRINTFPTRKVGDVQRHVGYL